MSRRPTHWVSNPECLRWAGEESVGLIGRCRQRSLPRDVRPPGWRAIRLALHPGSFYLAAITWERTTILEHPPQTHVRPKLEPRFDGAADFDLNG